MADYEAIFINFAYYNDKNALKMKKILFAIMMLFPLVGMAQNTTTDAQANQQAQNEQRHALFEKRHKAVDAKYLKGAVPEVDGKVVFTLDKDVPGMTADQIYEKVRTVMENIIAQPNQVKELSKIAVDNKSSHTLGARFTEWLVFSKKALNLDQTVFNYTLIAKVSDGHLHLTMERLSYQYEMERPDTQGMETKAEDWITDKWGLNKKGDKLAKYSGKFRRRTIDRKDEIFKRVCKVLNVAY